MTDRVALIPGGARGIGQSIAKSLGERGWRIALCYRSSAQDAEETVSHIQDSGAEAFALACDVSDPKAAEDLIAQVHARWGRIDALINAAGPYHRIGIFKESLEGWHSMFDNNLHPVFYLCRAIAPLMKEQSWGRILNFSMATADKLEAKPMVTAHYIAKVGVLALTRAMAKALARHQITVNAISPGFVDSQSAPAEELERMCKHIPAGYIGETQDVVSAALFLLSEEARYITGANLVISGGWGV